MSVLDQVAEAGYAGIDLGPVGYLPARPVRRAAAGRRFATGLARVVGHCRDRGYEPTFHPETGTYVEAPWEIEEVLNRSDIGRAVVADRARGRLRFELRQPGRRLLEGWPDAPWTLGFAEGAAAQAVCAAMESSAARTGGLRSAK
jgi:sugar phosphate isomerase/epimerase